MNKKSKYITVFEHETIKVGQKIDGILVDETIINQLGKFYGDKGVPFFSLTNKGVRFCEYVGVLQVGNLTINILPKADKKVNKNSDISVKKDWNSFLIGMLQSVGIFNVKAPSLSSLKLKSNSILDLYIELFVKEVNYLIHKGLIKKYRKTEGNCNSLKGRLQFSKNIQKNSVHKERFYVKYSTYDGNHKLHQILLKTLKLLNQVNTNSTLQSELGSILLDFPELLDIIVSEATFETINYNRKTEGYKNAIEIARLLLLNYHPDVSVGKNNILALLFDMNLLWEQFVYVSLRKYKPIGSTITAQTSKYFWRPEKGRVSEMRPDIVINRDRNDCIVLDTKWKNLNGYNPSPADLRQMYAYSHYYDAKLVALVYPGEKSFIKSGTYELEKKDCSIISLSIPSIFSIKDWQKEISKTITEWYGEGEKVI
ncbi:restriction endonuclease [Lutibacter sp. TH_r2]|uniref:McrC family protein n=1 Tax=Lutibacter sp. TH_r2 TaxID=3082083 RepID=UPI002953B143|nr:restriction endonuclease [Lutibacter sp. TH_r2]MDV7187425.1 restriction endonuclease [Lutibacter sp. TH_r2]